jgi:hypothetical protein
LSIRHEAIEAVTVPSSAMPASSVTSRKQLERAQQRQVDDCEIEQVAAQERNTIVRKGKTGNIVNNEQPPRCRVALLFEDVPEAPLTHSCLPCEQLGVEPLEGVESVSPTRGCRCGVGGLEVLEILFGEQACLAVLEPVGFLPDVHQSQRG